VQDVAYFFAPVGRSVLPAFEKTPACVLEHRLIAFARHLPSLLGADIVDRLIQLGHDVKKIENLKRLVSLFLNDVQVRLPHVAGYESESFGARFSEHLEELSDRRLRTVPTNPKEPTTSLIDLLDDGQILMPLPHRYLVDADREPAPAS
jgi:hypothetical protein